MTVTTDGKNIYVVCYPGGAGGRFVSSALQHVLYGSNFSIDPQHGHCHMNLDRRFPNIFHGPTMPSMQQEISNIQNMDFVAASVYNGHYRNLVGIQDAIITQLGYQRAQGTKFIKISTDPQCKEHALFTASMLRKKVGSYENMSLENFVAQTVHYLRSWYWIENSYTKEHTVNLCITDVFRPELATKKLQTFLDAEQIIQFDKCHGQYLKIQWNLYPDLMALLN